MLLSSELLAGGPLSTVLRTVAHDLRQPLSTIESIAYYLNLILPPEDRKARDQVAKLQHLVEHANWIISSGVQLADPTPPAPVRIDLEKLIGDAVSPLETRPLVTLKLEAAPALVHLDPRQGRRLISSILGMFRVLAGDTHAVDVATERASTGVAMHVTTSATGYCDLACLPAGCELSIAGARRIAESHGGEFTFTAHPLHGLSARLVFQ